MDSSLGALSACSYQPRKLSFGNFGSLRKKKQDESEEYVCPMDVEMPKGRSFQKGFELQIYEDDLDRLEQVSFFFKGSIEWFFLFLKFFYLILFVVVVVTEYKNISNCIDSTSPIPNRLGRFIKQRMSKSFWEILVWKQYKYNILISNF